jgi:hypothetical protein
MATGFCPSVLLHINEVAEGNAPGRKLHIAGFLASLFCCQNSTVSPINTEQFTGAHKRGVTVKYRQRPTISHVQDEDDCDINRVPAYAEWTVPSVGHKQSSFFLDDNTIQQYCNDASMMRSAGVPPSGLMQEIYDLLLEHANVVMKAINQDLVTDMSTQFGENVTTGSSTGKLINISKTADQLILDNGVIDMLRDLQENEICDSPCVVGGGLFAAYNLAQTVSAAASNGIDISRLGMPNFFFDKDTQTIWGQNTVGVFAKGSVKFIGRNKYQGAFGGARGTSYFMTLPLPVAEFGCNLDECLRDLIFDVQLKYIDCPTSVTINGTPTTVDRGWQVIVSKEFALWVQPTSAYGSGDTLEGTNGTLKYFIRNTSYTGGSYAAY